MKHIKHWIAIGGCLGTISLSLAQTPTSNLPAINPLRMDRVWNAMNNRMVEQNDFWFKKGDFPRCIQLMRIQAELAPGDHETVSNLGWLLESTQQFDEALAVYVRHRLRNPNDPEAPFYEADFYFKRKAYAKVPPLLEPTLAKKPHPNSFRTLAHAYEKLGLLQDSRRVWQQLLKITPNDPAAKLNLQRVVRKLQPNSQPPN